MGDPTSIDRWAYASLNRFLLRFWVAEERRGTMKTNETEVLTVGAGPAGLIAAREAAEKGAEVTVLEEHPEIGLPCHCAGLLSLKGLRDIGVSNLDPFVQNMVRGARFFSPSGLSFTVEKDEAIACVVDRRLFDKSLARQATEAGARIKMSMKVSGLERVRGGVAVTGKQESARAKIVIDAEGASSRIVKSSGLKSLDPACVLPGLQSDLRGVDVDPDFVEIHVGRRVAPRFFAWVIPLSEDSVRVGLACKGATPKGKLDRFIEGRFGHENDLERIAVRSGRVVTCGPIQKTFDDSLLVVGDAAGQVKPITGGGVILGGICASIAGEVAAEAVEEGDFSGAFLGKYESFWKEKLDQEFRMTLLARRTLNNLSDKAIDKVFKVIIEQDLPSLLSEEGDIDFQTGVLRKALKRKEILRILPSFLGALSPFKRRTEG